MDTPWAVFAPQFPPQPPQTPQLSQPPQGGLVPLVAVRRGMPAGDSLAAVKRGRAWHGR